MLLVSIVIFVGLLIVLKKTRIGLIVQAGLTHPHMVGHLGHNVGRIFTLVFGVGTALAAVAGVIAEPALVTQSNMAGLLGPILFVVVVVGGLGSLPRGLHRLAANRPAADLRGLDERLAVGRLRSAQSRLCLDLARQHLGRHHRTDRADHALAPPLPAAAEKLKFYSKA
jgi:hypothetical protein